MADSLTKSRIISFRVSDDEYRVVDEASKKCGFASVSLFARSATLTGNAAEPVRTPLDREIGNIWRRIDTLSSTLEQIAAHLCFPLDPPTVR